MQRQLPSLSRTSHFQPVENRVVVRLDIVKLYCIIFLSLRRDECCTVPADSVFKKGPEKAAFLQISSS